MNLKFIYRLDIQLPYSLMARVRTCVFIFAVTTNWVMSDYIALNSDINYTAYKNQSTTPDFLEDGNLIGKRSADDETMNTRSPNKRRPAPNNIYLLHMEADQSKYRMEIERAGQILNIWTVRNEKRRYRAERANVAQYHNNGAVRILTSGVFLLYSQLTYYDNSGRWSHGMKRNNDVIAKCIQHEWGMSVDPKTMKYVPTAQTCVTNIVTYLQKGDLLSIVSFYERRTLHHAKDMTYWGVIKIG